MTYPLRSVWRSVPRAALCVGLLLALSGCGGSSNGLLPVEGKITVENKPLPRGSVAFHPDAKKNSSKKVASGDIGADGTYKLYTDGQAGAPPGWYKVTVVSTTVPDSARPNAAKSYVGLAFTKAEETPLSVEVTASPKAGHYDLTVRK